MRILSVLSSCLLLASSAAGGVIVVDASGGGAFTSIQSAVDAASPGDLLLVKSGTYAGFTVDGKPLTIVEDAGHTASVAGGVTVKNVISPLGVQIVGLDVHNSAGTALTLTGCAGPVLVEQGAFLGDGFPVLTVNHAANLFSCDLVAFTACSFDVAAGSSIGEAGILSTQTNLCLFDCDVKGGDQTLETIAGGAGLEATGGYVFLSGSSFTGGQGGPALPPGLFTPCKDAGPGGPAVLFGNSGRPGSLRDVGCAYTGGAGGSPGTTTCNAGAQGPGLVVASGDHLEYAGPATHYALSSVVRQGNNGFVDVEGVPGDGVFLFLSATAALAPSDAARGPLLVGAPTFSFFLGLLDGAGAFHLVVPVPASQPALSGRLVEQVVTYSATSGPRVSPVRTGVVLDRQF